MSHEHGLSPGRYDWPFRIGIALNVGFVVVEVVFGLLADSLALLADAGHNLSDVLGLFLAAGAYYLMRRRPDERHTYGWGASSILAAVANALLLLVAVGAIGWEAIRRFGEPAAVSTSTIIWVAAVGTVINGVTAALFVRGRKEDLNIQGAFIHMAADAGVSLGVVAAGLAMQATGWTWLDPAVSLAIAAAILATTWGLLRESLHLAMGGVPSGIDVQAVRSYLRDLPGVEAVHDLHIWAMSTTGSALTAHLVKPDPEGDDALLAEATEALHRRFGIEHTTIQWERGQDAACQAPCE
jgi:cobalt-zinc-cadmium efflux system protein